MARVDQRFLRRWVGLALALPIAVGLTASAGAAPVAGQRANATSLSTLRATLERASLHGVATRGLAAATGSAATDSAATPCGSTGVLCSDVVVPLDRTGVVPGSVSLHVEVLPAQGTPRGVVFLIAGGPGQGSAHVYGLGDDSAVSLYRFLFPGYTFVAYDDRGTGASGLLDCPELQKAATADAEQSAATACANQIGPQRDFYSTADHAEDLEAVRQALGFDKIALFGVSYGTKLAMAYALAHPDHVERLLLDSVLPPEQPDPYEANVLQNLPATLNAFCSDGGCRAATSNFAGDVIAVANKLGAKPLTGKVTESNGRTKTVTVGGVDLLSIILGADLSPGLAAELPAVVKAARSGNTQPLLRLADLQTGSGIEPSIELSDALYAATVCHDGPFPWAPDTPVAARPALEQAAIAALAPGSFGPFGHVGRTVRQRRLLPRLAEPRRRRRSGCRAAARTCRCSRSAAASTCARRPQAQRPSSRVSRRASCSSCPESVTARSPPTSRLRRPRSPLVDDERGCPDDVRPAQGARRSGTGAAAARPGEAEAPGRPAQPRSRSPSRPSMSPRPHG